MRTKLASSAPYTLRTPSRMVACVLSTLLLLCFAVSGCSASRAASSASASQIGGMTIEEAPQGIGRGFPVASIPQGTQRPNSLKVGTAAPQFALTFDDEQSLTLADLRGRPVMINFWATWCPPCRSEMPEIVHHAKTDDDLIVLAVNVREGLEQVRAFADEYDMIMPVVLDRNGDLQSLYLLRGMPTSIFIDREGVIVSTWEGMLSVAQLESMLDGIR